MNTRLTDSPDTAMEERPAYSVGLRAAFKNRAPVYRDAQALPAAWSADAPMAVAMIGIRR